MAKSSLSISKFLLIVLIFLSACNLKTAPVASPISNAPTTTAIPATPDQTGPLSLIQLYQARVTAGTWSEGQGLVNLLGIYTGATNGDAILGSSSPDDSELTGLVRLADKYLADHPTGDLHDQVQRQLNQLVAPLDRLGPFSRKGSLSAGSIRLANLSLPAPHFLAGDEATCQDIWANGFTSSTPVICLEYDEATADDVPIRLYYPSWWAADDPKQAFLEPILQAAVLAVQTFDAYGPNHLSPVTLIVTDLPGFDPRTHARSANLFALARPVGNPQQCYVGLFPVLFTLTVAKSQQAIAHEIFHCYQFKNLYDQLANPSQSANEWWVEGSAEYFSNVVYPSVNLEYQRLGEIQTDIQEGDLFSWGYNALIFFQYLENRSDTGQNGVLAMLRAMPTAPGSDVALQRSTLSAYPNIATIFQEFAQALADQHVLDSAPGHPPVPLAVPYAFGDVTEVTPGDILSLNPFTVSIRRVIFPEHLDYNLAYTINGGPFQYSARLEDSPGTWAAVPAHVDGNCSEVRYLVVVTQTSAVPNDSDEFRMTATSNPSSGSCSCLNGSWLMDNDSYLANMNAMIDQSAPGTINYTSVDGSVIVEFTPDRQINQTINNLQVTADMDVSGMPTQALTILMSGTSNAHFSATHYTLTYASINADLTIDTLLNGQSLGTSPADYLSYGPLGTGAMFVCSDTTLTLVPIYPNYTNLPPLSFSRQP